MKAQSISAHIPVQCPLNHPSVTLVETVSSRELALAYREQYQADVSRQFAETATISFYRCNECGLGFFDPVIPGPPEFYSELSKIPWYYAEEKHEYRIAARRVKPDQKVLEVGCGKGAFTKYLKTAKYVGLEYNPSAVKTATDAGLDVRAMSAEDFALTHEGGFDVVCSFQVLEHVPDPMSFIHACVKCARPGGTVIFGVPNSGAFLGACPDDILSMPPHHLTWWDEDVFWKVAPQFGLEVVAMEAEPLSSTDAYSRTKALRILMGKFKMRQLFLFRGARYRMLRRMAVEMQGLMMAGMYDPRLSASGNSLLAVLRKDSD